MPTQIEARFQAQVALRKTEYLFRFGENTYALQAEAQMKALCGRSKHDCLLRFGLQIFALQTEAQMRALCGRSKKDCLLRFGLYIFALQSVTKKKSHPASVSRSVSDSVGMSRNASKSSHWAVASSILGRRRVAIGKAL